MASRPGVSQVTTGAGISKPVIRGLGWNRVVVISDGIRQEGQQWGDEHGIEVDAQGISSVEILKGPASLMYGSDAMAGVLIMHTWPQLTVGQHRGELSTEYQTNNGMAAYSLGLAGNEGRIVWDARYSERYAHDYRNAKDGTVDNSRFRERALSGLIGANHRLGKSSLRLSYYRIVPGMVEGDEEEEEAEEEGGAYAVVGPHQIVDHTKAVSDHTLHLGEHTLHATVGYQANLRREYEDEEADLDMLLHTVSYDVRWLAPKVSDWQLTAGVGGMGQANRNRGEEYLIPNYRLFDLGLYATAERRWQRITLSGGLRYDHRQLHATALEERFEAFRRSFDGPTGSAGVAYNAAAGLTLRANIARGFRAPNISELGSNGEHEGTYRYEVGTHSLRAETSWQGDLGLDYEHRVLSLRLAAFANRICNYVFAERLEGEYVDGVPVYAYVQGDALLCGGEAMADIHILPSLHCENAFSFVSARQLNTTADRQYLPMTPAPRWTTNLRYQPSVDECRALRSLVHPFVSVGVEHTWPQNHYLAYADTETPTAAYTLLSASIGTGLRIRGRERVRLTLVGNNLTNCAYQSHLSRLKYAGADGGLCNMGRNVSIKVNVPFAW